MGAILWHNYRRTADISVPSPLDPNDGPDTPYWWKKGAAEAREFALAGITAVLHFNVLEQANNASSGYAPFNDYGIGNRAGTREHAIAFHAVCHANGMQNYEDVVNHQRMGGRNGSYVYDSVTTRENGRFPKIPSYFTRFETEPDGSLTLDKNGQPILIPGSVPLDPIDGPIMYDIGPYAFGDLLSPVNALPKGKHESELQSLLNAAGDWMFRTLGSDGDRLDDTKGQAVAGMLSWLNFGAMAHKLAFGEYADGNPANLNWWVWQSGMGGRCMAFDFGFHYAVQGMCNNNSNWDMRQLVGCGFAAISPYFAITFVESPDTDTDGFATVVWNKKQGYFFMLTYVGYPLIYYRDWSTDPDCYGLKQDINNYLWIHQFLAQGELIWRHSDFQHVVYERSGNLICGINNDQYHGWWTYWGPTNFPPFTELHDHTGHNQLNCRTDKNSWVTFGVPPNHNGEGTVAFGPLFSQSIVPATHTIVQTIFGAADLQIGPAMNGINTLPDGIYAVGEIRSTLKCDESGWVTGSHIVFSSIESSVANYHILTLTGTDLPATGTSFELTITYTAPQTI